MCASQYCDSSPTSPHLYTSFPRIWSLIPGPRVAPCFASTATRVSRTISVPTKRTLPCDSPIAARMSIRPASIFILSPAACFAASGLWHPEPPTLMKVRNTIVSRPKEWRAVHKLLNWDDAGKLRRPPRGFPADHEFVEDLKLRDLGSAVNFTDKQVCSTRFMSIFVQACRTMSPVAAFFSGAVGLKF